MSDILDRYYAAKELAEERQRSADKAIGARDQLKKELQEEFGVASVAKANLMLVALTNKENLRRKQLDNELTAFEEEFTNGV